MRMRMRMIRIRTIMMMRKRIPRRGKREKVEEEEERERERERERENHILRARWWAGVLITSVCLHKVTYLGLFKIILSRFQSCHEAFLSPLRLVQFSLCTCQISME